MAQTGLETSEILMGCFPGVNVGFTWLLWWETGWDEGGGAAGPGYDWETRLWDLSDVKVWIGFQLSDLIQPATLCINIDHRANSLPQD